MPAFLLILFFVILINWLGWWLLAIVAGLAASSFGILLYVDKRQSQSTWAPQIESPRQADFAAQSARTIRIKINSVTVGGTQAALPRQRSLVSSPNEFRPNVALIIKDEPLERILSGGKTWEMRAQHTRKRETVALAKKGTGQVFGVADIVDSRGPLSDATMMSTVPMHGIASSRLLDPDIAKYRYAWVLTNIRRLPHPIPYSHTKGAQSFVLLDEETSRSIVTSTSRP